MIEDVCGFIKDIEANPSAPVKPFTVRDWLNLTTLRNLDKLEAVKED